MTALLKLIFLTLCLPILDQGPTPAVQSDSDRFRITAVEAKRNYEFALEHYNWCQQNVPNTLWERQAQYCYQAWDALDNVKRFCFEVHEERMIPVNLERLRDLLGQDAWAIGRMPPPAPYWYFQEKSR
jgi:hypothetical protein